MWGCNSTLYLLQVEATRELHIYLVTFLISDNNTYRKTKGNMDGLRYRYMVIMAIVVDFPPQFQNSNYLISNVQHVNINRLLEKKNENR